MALTLTEDVVRSRVNLTHDKLEDVKSLSLPGTYHEKIISLGSALRKFTRLKSLDLSRNALESIQGQQSQRLYQVMKSVFYDIDYVQVGIESLELLEKLNLYYNNIGSLDELKRLKHTPSLKELDLRLNPVTRSEPDYRLYLIHMLPNLQKLDDRGVRDRERQAALIHFSSSQATEMTHHPTRKEPAQKPPHPRVELTAKLGKPSVLDDDDVALMDLVALKGGDLSRNRPLTGSAAKEAAMEEYSLEILKSLGSSQDEIAITNGAKELPSPGKKRSTSLPPPKDEDRVVAAYKDKYPNITSLVREEGLPKRRNDPNLQYQDELDAYSKYKSHGFFTPHPTKNAGDEEDNADISQIPTERSGYPPPPDLGRRDREWEKVDSQDSRQLATADDGGDATTARHRHRRTNSTPNIEPFPTERSLPDPSASYHQSLRPSVNRYDPGLVQTKLEDNPSARNLLFRILDLVDRYWNGSKSLHQHAKFLALALGVVETHSQEGPLAGMQQDVSSLKQRVQRLQEENSTLRERQARRPDPDATTASEVQMIKSLKKAQSDVDHLREELKYYVKENATLQRKLEHQESAASFNVSGAASSNNPLHLDDLQRQNNALSREIEGLRSRLKQYAQMQEMASMLQESHKSLVQTNDHLLKEMEEERRRHRHEVEQMHWSYDQLRKTITCLPSTIKGDSTVNLNTNNSSTAAAGLYRDTDR